MDREKLRKWVIAANAFSADLNAVVVCPNCDSSRLGVEQIRTGDYRSLHLYCPSCGAQLRRLWSHRAGDGRPYADRLRKELRSAATCSRAASPRCGRHVRRIPRQRVRLDAHGHIPRRHVLPLEFAEIVERLPRRAISALRPLLRTMLP